MRKKETISLANSFQGFDVLYFMWRNKLKVLAVLIAVLQSLVTQFPQLVTQLATALAILEELYKFWAKEKRI